MSAKWRKGTGGPAGDEAQNLVTHDLTARHDSSEDGTGRGTPLAVVPFVASGFGQNQLGECRLTEDVAMTLSTGGGKPGQDYPAVAISFQERGRDGGPCLDTQANLAYALTAPSGGGRRQEKQIQIGMTVRRLLPVECLRLQGMPDDFLDLTPPLADSVKYRITGNAVARPVFVWVGERLRLVDAGIDPNQETP